ncbi:P-loop containing nucleoside triphosphate hydrolase protein [Crucibulum laeve]|uniref:P-loop containing nucleoside triphosphate hydrolase protein n=1 Tax=Crucibulum laeve TaxID=68775 RepID=A0A5C3LY85_9AGAR|nr:P-loop containing nucleoside triphosphate hydrolase protein [Crucibulum laeve]
MNDFEYYSASKTDGSRIDGVGGVSEWLTRVLGLSFLASLFSNSYVSDSVKLFILGTIIETGRRFCYWLFERMWFQYSITIQVTEGDPTYDWIILFLTQEKVWRRARDFRVTAKSSRRTWSVKSDSGTEIRGNADYVPTYQMPHLFRWNGYWVEIKRSQGESSLSSAGIHATSSTLFLTLYTLNMNAISELVEDARLRYIEVSRPNVIIHSVDMNTHFGASFQWNNVKRKARRPLNSIILPEGVTSSLVEDAQEFFTMEDWYVDASIPHRRGYLFHGPPGTGKKLGLEIYSLSLASTYIDDSFLQRAAASIPKKSIFLIEDIDCAFPSREESDDGDILANPPYASMVIPAMHSERRRSAVTLSGLLNVLDGVGSEEGKLFFATTNHVDHLDPALIRPGRIDKKVQYKLATKEQAKALFLRFFPESHTNFDGTNLETLLEKRAYLQELAMNFSGQIPEYEFSTAELQGYLLSWKKQPVKASENVIDWVEQERREKRERNKRKGKKCKSREEKERREVRGGPISTSDVTEGKAKADGDMPASNEAVGVSAPEA